MNKITRIKKNDIEYTPYPQDLSDALLAAETNAQESINAANASATIWAQNLHLVGLNNIPYFDPYKDYNEYELVLYKGDSDTYPHVYRSAITHTARNWQESDWIDTSAWSEIQNMRIGVYQYETCRLQLILDGDGVLNPASGAVKVTVTVNGVGTDYYTSDNGEVEFQVQKGLTYIVSVGDIVGYFSPAPVTFISSMNVRPVRLIYRSHRSGWYVVWDNNGKDETLISEWNTDNNDKAIAVKFYSSLGSFSVLKNSPIGSSLQWCVQQYQFDESLLPNLDNAKAIRDFGSFNNTNNIIALADNPTDGYGVVNNWVMNTALQSYVPAAKWCRNQLITIDGSVYSGNLPAAGVLNVFTIPQNMTDMHEALTLIGSSVLPNIRSDLWWSSSQNSATTAWRLGSSIFRNDSKTSAYLVLPVFDL